MKQKEHKEWADTSSLSKSMGELSESKERENIRISEEIFRNEMVYLAHELKSEYLKYNSHDKFYFLQVDYTVINKLSQFTTLVRFNNALSINSLFDFYILQSIILDKHSQTDYIKKEIYEKSSKKWEDLTKSLQDEIGFLRERVKSYQKIHSTTSPRNLESPVQMLERRIKDITEQLDTKSREIIELESKMNNNENEMQEQISKLFDVVQGLSNENEMMGKTFKELVNAYKLGSEASLKKYLLQLIDNYGGMTNMNNMDLCKNIFGNKQEEEVIQNVLPNSQKNSRILNEFDRVFKDRCKKMERFYSSKIMNRSKSMLIDTKISSDGKTRNSSHGASDSEISNSNIASSSTSRLNNKKTNSGPTSSMNLKRVISNNDKQQKEKIESELRKLLFSYRQK